MYPELFSIGKLTVHSYGLMMALAILVATLALYREAPGEKINPDYLLEAIIVAAFFGLIGSRILYIILHWRYYSTQPFLKILTEFEGLTFYGAMFGGVNLVLPAEDQFYENGRPLCTISGSRLRFWTGRLFPKRLLLR